MLFCCWLFMREFKALFLHADFTHDKTGWVFFFSLFSNGQSGTLEKRPEKFNVQNSSLITVSVAGLNKHPQSKSFILVLIISGQEVKDVLNCFEWNYEACELMCVIYRERRPCELSQKTKFWVQSLITHTQNKTMVCSSSTS